MYFCLKSYRNRSTSIYLLYPKSYITIDLLLYTCSIPNTITVDQLLHPRSILKAIAKDQLLYFPSTVPVAINKPETTSSVHTVDFVPVGTD